MNQEEEKPEEEPTIDQLRDRRGELNVQIKELREKLEPLFKELASVEHHIRNYYGMEGGD